MNTTLILILTPFITAGIGWLTNWVAIQMLFHPRKSIRVLFWHWQGLIPRRQKQLAAESAEIIEREILQQHMVLHEIKKIEAGPLMEKVATQFENSVNLKQMIEDNIAAFDLDRLEAIVKQVASSEFRTIERLGALLRFVIGCLQVTLFWVTGSIHF